MNSENYFNLTPPQENIWNSQKIYKNSTFFNISGYTIFHDKLNIDVLKESIKLLITSNDSMRLQFCFDDCGNPKQYITDEIPKDFPIKNFINIQDLESFSSTIQKDIFTLLNSRLYEFYIFTLPNGEGGFLAKIHHIIADAWSSSLIVNKIITFYENIINKKDYQVDSFSYTDFMKKYQLYLCDDNIEKSKNFWIEKIFNTLDFTFLRDSSSFNCTSERFSVQLSKKQMSNINSFCTKFNISFYCLYSAALGIYLSKLNSKESAIIGSPVLNRLNYQEKNTLGMFVNTIPIKIDVSRNMSILEYLTNLSISQKSYFRHQKYPYEMLLNEMRKKYNFSQNIFDVSISYQNARTINKSSSISFERQWTFNGGIINNLDIHIVDLNDTDILSLFYDYKTSILSEQEIKQIHKTLFNIINKFIEDPNQLIKDIEIVTPEEKQYLLNTFNDTYEDIPVSKTVFDLFKDQVQKTPNNIAISYLSLHLTYERLLSLVNNFSNFLIKNNIKKGDSICLLLDNSPELIICILSILQIGAYYIPIDTKTPEERVNYIIQNSHCKIVLTNKTKSNIIEKFNLKSYSFSIDIDFIFKLNNYELHLPYKVLSNDIAYILYTSGSTGKPKGVKVSHKSLTNYICFANKYYIDNEACNFPLYSSISFDLTVTSIFTPLVSGNCICIYKNNNIELLLKNILEDRKTQVIKLTPAHLTLLQDFDLSNTTLKTFIVGGDNLPTILCENMRRKINNTINIYNEYGPTEATVGCMIYRYNENLDRSFVPIGKPAINTKIYILNKYLELLPINTVGEIYIGGTCLSKGYFNLEKITSEKFIKNPYENNSIIYKTGDLAKMYTLGTIEYLGRTDFQVKINGFRIEIGEIQTILNKYKYIIDCLVNVQELLGHKILCAYYVSDKEIDSHDLKNYLSKYLPNYMIPSIFIRIDKIPLTINGKIDKNKLPSPILKKEIVDPSNKIEELLCSIFCKLLGLETISVEENFFNYYIDSLIIIKIQTQLYRNNINIDTQAFYENTTIRKLTNYILENTKYKNLNCTSKNIFLNNISEIKKQHSLHLSYDNILLFGSTGFLGIHILYMLLKYSNSKIYCIIRNKNKENPINRMKHKLDFYFKLDIKDFSDRIVVINGNILDDNFGISNNVYEDLINKIDLVIDCAAIVKHYGNYNLFNETNVDGTNKIVDFCIKAKAPLHYMSTISISGYGLIETEKVIFTENNFYFGQPYYKNVYVRSKFEAENIILQACKNKNLIATIYRLGNITNRYSDGLFQENVGENAFINRLLAFINLKCIPKEICSLSLEFTPVDVLSKFIVELIKQQQNYNINIYHLFNDNKISILDFTNYLIDLNIPITFVNMEKFKEKIQSSSTNYFGIINYIQNLQNDKFSNIQLDNFYTNSILKSLNLEWPKIDNIFIKKLINYLKNNNLII